MLRWYINWRRSASVSGNRCAGDKDVVSPAVCGATLAAAVAVEAWRRVREEKEKGKAVRA
jgi:hypothetical protein